MNDLTLQKARAYEAEHSAAISPAERPAYHMTPYVGWLNDPNGFSYYKGKYHQFYQYNPYDVRWAPMHWGHAVSTDLLHWEYLPCALAPDSPADNGPGCFSGSATKMDDGKQLLMYTSVVAEKQPNGEMRDIQTQSIAIGDGLNYEKPACNPVLTQKDLPEGFSKFDFRDPKIWREADGTYSIVTVCLAEDGSGAAALFQNKDGRIIQVSVRELDAVHGKRTFHENVTVQSETSLEGIKGRVADLTVTVQPGEYRSFTLKLVTGVVVRVFAVEHGVVGVACQTLCHCKAIGLAVVVLCIGKAVTLSFSQHRSSHS